MTGLTLIYTSILVLVIAATVFLTAFLITRYVLIPYRSKTVRGDFLMLLDILKSIIQIEFDAYNNDIIRSRSTITNSNYENFFNDLVVRITAHLSENFYHEMEHYASNKFVYTVITKSVRSFLQSKITTSVE